MANRFYQPTQSVGSRVLDLAKFGMQLQQLQNQGKALRVQEAETDRLMDQSRVKFGDPTAPEGSVERLGTERFEAQTGRLQAETGRETALAATAAQRLAEEKFRAEQAQIERVAVSPVDKGRFATIRAAVTNQFSNIGLKKPVESIMGLAETAVNNGASPIELKRIMQASVSPQSRTGKALYEGLNKEMEKAVEMNDPAKIQQLQQTINALNDPLTFEALFPAATQFERNRLAALEEQRTTLKPGEQLVETQSGQLVASGSEQPVTGTGQPYYTPVYTGEGVLSFNARTGAAEPLQVGQEPVLGAKQDPGLTARLEEAKAAGKGIGETNMAQYELATNAVANINKIDDLINHIETSKAITGIGADLFKNIERVKSLVGSDVASGKVADTELLDVMMGAEVFPMIKSLGVGAKGLDTPAEREFMRKVLTGELSLSKKTLLEMTKIRRKVAERAIEKWNKRTNAGELDKFYEDTGLQKQNISVPEREKAIVDALPQGARQIGTYQGKPVFETPDGRRLIQE